MLLLRAMLAAESAFFYLEKKICIFYVIVMNCDLK